MLKNYFRRNSWTEKAQGMVEFGLVIPVLLLLVYGIIEFGRMLFIYSSVTTASREAARYGSAVNRVGGTTPQYLDCAGILNAARRAAIITPINATDVSIRYDHGPGTATIATSCEAAQNQSFVLGDRIVVRVVVPYSPVIGLVNFASFDITSTTARTILKAVEVQGTPVASLSEPEIYFISETDSGEEKERKELRVILDGVAINNIYVEFAFEGTATSGADYSIKYSTLTIPAGTLSGSIFTVAQVEDDLLYEDDETIVAKIMSVIGAKTKEPSIETMTIINNAVSDDPPPEIAFATSETTVDEGGDSKFIEVAIVSPPYASGKDVQVSLATPFGGTAIPSDYTLSKTTVTIPAGSPSGSILVTALKDNLYEGVVDTLILTLADPPVNAVLSPSFPIVHTVYINDTDTKPKVFFDLASQKAVEGVTLKPKLLMDKVSELDTVVTLLAVDETATLNADYQLPQTSVTIPAGLQEATVNIPILSDTVVESDETFKVTINTVTNGDKGTPSEHAVTISDNTNPPVVSFESSGKPVSEGDGRVLIRIILDHVWNQDVTVPYSVIGGTATEGVTGDYTITGNQVTIQAGSLYQNAEVNIIDDPIDEYNETIILGLGSPTNATKGTPDQFVVTIADNDNEPQIYFATESQSVPENAGQVTVDILLGVASAKDVSASILVSGNATEGTDYTISAKSVAIPAGSTKATVTINVIDDTVPSEGNERVILTLVNPVNAVVGPLNVHTTSIIENDFCPYISTWDAQPNQGFSTMLIGFTYYEGQPTIHISEVDVWWYSSPGQKLARVEWIGKAIYAPQQGTATEPTFITTFSGTLTDRQYLPTSLEKLMLIYFTKDLQGAPEDYDLTVKFDNGCIVTH